MKSMLLFVFATFATVYADSCIPTVSTVPVPASIEQSISQAETVAADITSIGSIISTAELSSPSLSYAENVLESYVKSYYSMIGDLITYYESPTVIPLSSISLYTRLTSAHSTLATAISEVVSFGETHASFSTAMQTLLSVELTQSSILTDLSEYTEIASPSVYEASNLVSQATLTSPSIVASVISIYTADVASPSVQSALSQLSASVYTAPSSVVQEVITYIQSPQTVAPSVIASLVSCYSTLYSDLTVVTSFTSSHASVVTAVTNLIAAASSVPSLSTAVTTIISYQMPTLVYDVDIVSHVTNTWPSFTTDLQILSGFTATSPTLSCDLQTIEQSFYNSPSIASSILIALESPSSVKDPQQVSQYEMSHSSLVTAIVSILSWESDYTSYAPTFSHIFYELTQEFTVYRTLLTDASYISIAASPSVASASYAISSLKTIVSDITSVLTAITYVTSAVPSLSCDESLIASYAQASPTVVLSIFDAMQSPTIVQGHTSYYAQLTASYASLASAIESVVSDESSYSALYSYEQSFIYAASIDSSILSQYSAFSTETSSAYSLYISSGSFGSFSSY